MDWVSKSLAGKCFRMEKKNSRGEQDHKQTNAQGLSTSSETSSAVVG